MRNKANFGELGRRRAGAGRTNKANWRVCGLASRRAIVRNKANSGRSRIGAKPFAGIELCRMYPPYRFGRTKPISATVPSGRLAFPRAFRVKQSQFLPLCRSGDRRSQGRDGAGRRNWRCGRRHPLCETNPISRVRPGLGGRSCKTNPISHTSRSGPRAPGAAGACGGANCAKQSQFRKVGRRWNTHHSSILSFHHPKPMSMVRNKANCGRSFQCEVSSV